MIRAILELLKRGLIQVAIFLIYLVVMVQICKWMEPKHLGQIEYDYYN